MHSVTVFRSKVIPILSSYSKTIISISLIIQSGCGSNIIYSESRISYKLYAINIFFDVTHATQSSIQIFH